MKKAVFFLLCAVCVSFTIGTAALSAAPETRPIEQEECDRLRRSVGITVLDQEPNIRSLTGFDIRADGAVLLGTDDPQKTVAAYAQDGTFLFGFTFRCSGDHGVKWDDDGRVLLYLVRSDIVLTVDRAGNVLNAVELPADNAENAAYVREEWLPKKRVIDGTAYRLKKGNGILGVFLPNYAELVRIDETGEEQIVIDLRAEHRLSAVPAITVSAVFIALLLLIVFGNRAQALRPKKRQ